MQGHGTFEFVAVYFVFMAVAYLIRYEIIQFIMYNIQVYIIQDQIYNVICEIIGLHLFWDPLPLF